MNRSISASVLALLILTPLLSAAATTFDIDRSHSAVEFGVSHMVITTVKGKFTRFTGSIVYGGDDLAAWEIHGTIEAASIDTDEKDRDNHLRSPDFFDTEKYPEITLKSKEIRREGDRYVGVGEFTMHGVTREVEIPFTLKGPVTDPWGNQRIGIEASWKLDRRDYGIVWSKTLDNGGLLVGNEVEIEIHIEAVHTPKSE
jgi:polyisoprenoid-binding protein YceI